jgi:hypothetical protein
MLNSAYNKNYETKSIALINGILSVFEVKD